MRKGRSFAARLTAGLTALALAAGLAACAALPTSGPVHEGIAPDDTASVPDLIYQPDKPAPGAAPDAIVSGFIAAATSPAGGWEIARLFLAPSLRDRWNPDEGVTIERSGSRRVDVSGDTITVTLAVAADVDATGAYRVAESGADTPAPLTYTVAQQPDGEWRITQAPDGIVLEANDFANVFHAYSLMYFDPTWTYLVPDVRWFPYRAGTTSRIVRALVEGEPSAWLAGSVSSAFGSDVVLASETIPLNSDGVARVDLDAGGADPASVRLSRMQRQLLASLQSASVTGIDLRVGSLSITTTPAPVASSAIDPRPLVRTDDAFGFASGAQVDSLTGALAPQVISAAPTAIALGRGQDVAAVLTPGGQTLRISGGGAARTEDARGGLVAPAIDPLGTIWSVQAADPAGLQVIAQDATKLRVANAFPGATGVRAISVARDGTRIAAITTGTAGDAIVVAGIVRAADGSISLGDMQRMGIVSGTGLDLVWLGDQTLGALAATGEGQVDFVTQPVGGPATIASAPANAREIAAGATVTAPRVLDTNGVLYTRRATAWQQTLTGVRALATQLGVG